MTDIIQTLSQRLKLAPGRVAATVALIDAGNTIPFIARYRKEVTGNLDDTTLRELDTVLKYTRRLEARKQEILGSIAEQQKLTPELAAAIEGAETLQAAEDLYLPYKKKRRTRAMAAREKGLEPLALKIAAGETDDALAAAAGHFVNDAVADAEAALAGARDIVAETIADNAAFRGYIRRYITENARIHTAVTEAFAKEKTPYINYYDHSEGLGAMANHRILAMNRAEKEKVITVKVDALTEFILPWLTHQVMPKGAGRGCGQLAQAAADAYKRLIFPAVEREIRAEMKERAEASAIRAFGINLRKLLLTRPFREKVTMGFDPGYRNGCKIAVLDPMGTLLATAKVYPAKPQQKTAESRRVILALIERYQVDMIAIGNGTASRESEQFIAETLKACPRRVQYCIVSEAGASIYSASPLAAAEYPDVDVSLRGAISIGGRLQDPLSELVKIEPEHIGVGQYQHDVNQKALSEALTNVVEDAVNLVGVDINRASPALLKYVAGITDTMADNIVAYREANGRFANRRAVLKVKGLGPRAYEQCAGFLRITGGEDVLDNTGIHPESYPAAHALMDRLSLTPADLKPARIRETAKILRRVDVKATARELGIGEPTLQDMIAELCKPGRDPRDEAPEPILKQDVLSLDDLKPDMALKGTVRNVVDFGAFVDIGVHQDGLVHISQISDRYVKHPSDVLSVGDVVTVKVLSVDKPRSRIALTMLL